MIIRIISRHSGTGEIEFDENKPLEEIIERYIAPNLAHLIQGEKEKRNVDNENRYIR